MPTKNIESRECRMMPYCGFYYPGCPETPDGWELTEQEYMDYCADMEEMRLEYERLMEDESPV